MIATIDQRIAVLRKRCIARKNAAWKDISIPQARALRESEHVVSWQERRGLCIRQVLADTVFELDELELLAGRLAPRPATITDDMLADARKFLGQHPAPGGQSGHCELDLRQVLDVGIDGVVHDVHARLHDADGERAATYRSFLFALEGLTAMIDNAAECARQASPGSSTERQRELELIAQVCTRIAHRPPESFRDALQLLWLVLLAVQYGENVWLIGPGHLDRTLGAF